MATVIKLTLRDTGAPWFFVAEQIATFGEDHGYTLVATAIGSSHVEETPEDIAHQIANPRAFGVMALANVDAGT